MKKCNELLMSLRKCDEALSPMFDTHVSILPPVSFNMKPGFQHFHLEITGMLSSSSAVDVSISSTTSSSSFVGTMKNKQTHFFKMFICVIVVNFS